MRYNILKLLFVFILAPAQCFGHSQTDVIDFSNTYLKAYEARDFGRVAQMTYAKLVEKAGGVAVWKQKIYDFDAQLSKDKEVPTRSQIVRIDWFESTGAAKAYFVEVARYTQSFPGEQVSNELYVVVDQPGSDLQMLDLGCISVTWVESVVPGFKDSVLSRRLIADDLLAAD